MNDKRNYLKLACLLNTIYIVISFILCLLSKEYNDEVLAKIFFLLLNVIFTIILYKESKKDIKYLKENKFKVIISSVWMFLDPIIPGILGFMFLYSIKEKTKDNLPIIKEKKIDKKTCLLQAFLIAIFLIVMMVLPSFSFFKRIPSYLIYITLILLVILFNFKFLKNDFKIFIKNLKSYIPFIIRRYFIMLGVMVLVAIPILALNNGNTSSNQVIINEMFKKIPIITLVLSTIYAPFVEENVFRLSLSKIINNKMLFIIISGFLFGALHIIDKFTSFNDLLYIFQYSALGICLAKAYFDSNNIFVSISMHFIQNFIAAILIILMY